MDGYQRHSGFGWKEGNEVSLLSLKTSDSQRVMFGLYPVQHTAVYSREVFEKTYTNPVKFADFGVTA